MNFKTFKEIKRNLKRVTNEKLLFIYYMVSEELKNRGCKIEVLENLKK